MVSKKENRQRKPRVLVAMSGGVDSSVGAALLCQNKNYEVVGAFMKQWSDSHELSGLCSWKRDRRDALRVAAKLGIPLLTLDFEKEYKKWVMQYMFAEYEAGRTPNPDVLCNKYIKFGVWLAHARKLGFDYLATGHYACIADSNQKSVIRNQRSISKRLPITDYRLLISKDQNKDQTYFLHQLTQEQLAHTLFPVAGYLKSEVRSLARKFGLPTAEREESMGICFVGEMPMKEFLLQKIKPKKGKIVMTTGAVVGEHDGLAFYTIGQRHIGNVKCQMSNVKCPETKPLYVVDKRARTNELVVGYENDPALYKKEILVTDVNWISGHEPEFPLKCQVRLRHRQEMQNAECSLSRSRHRGMQNGDLVVRFAKPQRAVTPGQFAVFYKKNQCLGGGIIV